MSILKILCQQPIALYHTSVSYIDYIISIVNDVPYFLLKFDCGRN